VSWQRPMAALSECVAMQTDDTCLSKVNVSFQAHMVNAFLPALYRTKLCKRWYSQSRDVRPSVHLSVCHTPVLYQTEKASVMISSPA